MKLVRSGLVLLCAGAATGIELKPVVKIPGVPGVSNPDANGMPFVQFEASVVGDIKSASASIGSGLHSLESKLQLLNHDNNERLTKERQVFNKRLKDQESKNLAIQRSNGAVAKKLSALQHANSELLNKLKQAKKANEAQREHLQAMQLQMSKVSGVVDKVLEKAQAEDQSPEVVALLEDKASFIQVESEEEIEPSDDSMSLDGLEADEANMDVALPQTSIKMESTQASTAQSGAADEAVSSLMVAMKHLRSNVQKAEETLKAEFSQAFKAGLKRFRALQKQQAALKKTGQDLSEYNGKLKSAYARVMANSQFLARSIAKTKAFLARMQTTAGAL
eukprot:TRINITY_DN2263_c0_g1_i1.p1 TRINITY_DN2263_c0_g1~~TRINITY_DN2263_c0_g1_i1.p1  ORF type:complete len:335 (+),score=100.96 TRINITY_DN2263_c0_g1_i1:72-1076(+)